MKKSRKTLSVFVTAIVVFALALILLNTSNSYTLFALNETFIYALCAMSVSVMLGMTGMMTFSSVSFYGIGAYIMANLATGRLGIKLEPGLVLIIAPILTALIAAIVGLPLLRLRGNYFTFSTIALVQVAFCFFNNTPSIFGGYDGISGIPTLSFFGWKIKGNQTWFFVLIAAVIIVALIIQRIRHSRLGRSMAAIRDNETAALTLGINVYRTRVITFAISAAICGFAGALYACFNRFCSADSFTYAAGIPFIIMAMLGGINSTVGCVLGAILVGMLPEWLRILESYMQLIYGIGVILLMIFMPMGLNGLFLKLLHKIKKSKTVNEGGAISDGTDLKT